MRTFEGSEPALSKFALGALRSLGFTEMTPVQAAAMPLFLTNKDVAVEACTGNAGIYAVFVYPITRWSLQRMRSGVVAFI